MTEDQSAPAQTNTVELATELTIAWLSNPNTRIEQKDVPPFLQTIHEAVCRLAAPSAPEVPTASALPEHAPAVSVRKSLANPDHILSMIDGKPYRTLRRHLATHGLTPEEYRTRYHLRPDYPMVAPGYSESRREMAKKIGLGRKPASATSEAAATPAAKPARKPRTPKADKPA